MEPPPKGGKNFRITGWDPNTKIEIDLGLVEAKTREDAIEKSKAFGNPDLVRDAEEFRGKAILDEGTPKPLEEPPKRREIEIPEPGPKKRYEVEEPPRRSLEASIRAMTDDDVRTAARTIESQMRRPGLSARARETLEAEFKPFRDEMERRNILDKPEKGFGENNVTFTRARKESASERLRRRLGGNVPKLYQSSEERFLITNED